MLGTGWPIVTGQFRAPAIVTGRGAAVVAGLAELVLVLAGLVLAGVPVQPRRVTARAAARVVVAAIRLRFIGGLPSAPNGRWRARSSRRSRLPGAVRPGRSPRAGCCRWGPP